ncbi:unnamed protein product [Didymodactylos carnosus]|uniref:FAD dependent oxidoreductase n=3 Tax=Didymodactylos carnosus TaxID=1234261 RepID=A0A815B5S1_9BILA|nr:unnamed protein product [Didymodactylos carnosus]CAF4047669.1 unnamed protein product [Didymodactylos carnosus]
MLKRAVIDDCQLLIIGGSTAALGAALSAARYTQTCLLEPTDWIGGQLTTESLAAPDFAWHKLTDGNFTLDVGAINRLLKNRNPLFSEFLILAAILPTVNTIKKNLRVFYNTVIKHIEKDENGRRIIGVDSIQRTAKTTHNNDNCRFLSEELSDWYSRDESPWFTKTNLSFTQFQYVIEGSAWGEVLALANVTYLQGLTEQFDGDTSGIGNSTCGQSFTFDFLEKLMDKPTDEPKNPLPDRGNYSLASYKWEQIWTYRRSNTTATDSNHVAQYDITTQNWGYGNDYQDEYFFLSINETQLQLSDWKGGVNLNAIQGAEERAYGYHYWYRANAPEQWINHTILLRQLNMTGTCHGLAKLPYLRESRRSIGIDNFLMNITTISGHARDLVGYIFDDRIAIGAYDVDIHSIAKCKYPPYIYQKYDILPFFIPLRSLTNRDIDNLIVVGKSIAQTFLVNAATRLHPIEFSVGQAGGVTAAYAILNEIRTTAELVAQHSDRIRNMVKIYTPTSWTINGTLYPPS